MSALNLFKLQDGKIKDKKLNNYQMVKSWNNK